MPLLTYFWHMEKQILIQSVKNSTVWEHHLDNIFSLGNLSKRDIEQANSHHHTIKFTAEISDTEVIFLDTVIQKGEGSLKEHSILDIKTHCKLTERLSNILTSGEHFKFQNSLAGYPRNLIEKVLSEINFTERSLGLIKHENKKADILPFVKKY